MSRQKGIKEEAKRPLPLFLYLLHALLPPIFRRSPLIPMTIDGPADNKPISADNFIYPSPALW